MIHTHMFILDQTDYRRLDDGSWRAEFPGRTFKVSATAPTLEQARSAVRDGLDEKLMETQRDDLRAAAGEPSGAVGESRKPAAARRSRRLTSRKPV